MDKLQFLVLISISKRTAKEQCCIYRKILLGKFSSKLLETCGRTAISDPLFDV